MNNVRVFYRDEEGLHQVNVSYVDTHSIAIEEVRSLLVQGDASENVYRRVMAVVDR
jgi:hypothetical protein